MPHDQQTYSRGVSASLLGLAVQIVLVVALLLASFWAEKTGWAPAILSLYAVTWYVFAAIPLWILVLLLYNEHRRERIESLEMEQIARKQKEAGNIFDERGEDLILSRRRLDRIYKWGVRVLAVAVAAFLFGMGLWFAFRARKLLDPEELAKGIPDTVNAPVLMTMAAAVAFIAFTLARYHAGMTKVREWQLLRGSAGHLMGASVMAIMMLVAAIFAQFGNGRVFPIVALIIPILMAALGVEMVAALMLGFYRPRKPGEMPRLPFDSRFLGWLVSPESIGKIVSETINYQFGWEISRSWFYQLLSRSMTWLIVFGAASILALSCVVMVGPQEQAIITRFGRIVPDEANAVRGPGLYFKLPWPMSQARVFPTGRIVEFSVGSVHEAIKPDQDILWTTPHGKEEYLVTPAHDEQGRPSTGIALAGAEIAVQYRVTDLLKYYNSANDPHALIVAMADRRLTEYFANHDIDNLIARGRIEAGERLQKVLQADAAPLGVELVGVNIKGIHPPQDEVAKAFLEQIGALQEREARIEKARQEATEIYSSVAGSPEEAATLGGLIKQYEAQSAAAEEMRVKKPADDADLKKASEELARTENQIVELITKSSGEAAEQIFAARADRWERVNAERARVLRFAAELAAYNNAKRYYAARLYLDVLAGSMTDARKYVILANQGAPLRFEIDLKEETKLLPGISGAGE